MERLLILALLSFFPHFPMRPCMTRRLDEIAAQARDAAERHGVPPAILLSVAFHETHCGCDEPDWGAPASRRQRHVAGTPDDAARALANAYAACRSWPAAVSRFRSGLCVAPTFAVGYRDSVMRLAGWISHRASRATP